LSIAEAAMFRYTASITLLLFFASLLFAATIHVPAEYLTIQAGIDASVNGDTVLVADGTYTGIGNKNIDFLSKAIVVSSENGFESCVIDCENDGRGFHFQQNEDFRSKLTGFSIINGFTAEGNGGGISCEDSSPTIEDCAILGNTAEDYGGGIYCYYSDLILRGCIISGNSITWNGGGAFFYNSNATVDNCIFEGNSALFAGGIWIEGSDFNIEGCRFTENSVTWDGGGMFIGFFSDVSVINCIFEGNSAWRGGGVWCHKSNATFRRCYLSNNSADCGGGFYCSWDAQCLIFHCTCSENSAAGSGGGLYIYYSSTALIHTIVEGSTGNGGVFIDDYADVEVYYSDHYNNENGSFLGQVPPGVGVLTTVNANSDSCDMFYNIPLDPLFYSTQGDSAYFLTAMSPCIDAGDPHLMLDPDSTAPDIGAYYYDQSAIPDIVVFLSLTGGSPVPPSGGNIYYDLLIINEDSHPLSFDACLSISHEGGAPFTFAQRQITNLPPGQTISRPDIIFPVPERYPAGMYLLSCKVGQFPGVIWAEDNFHFTKAGLSDGREFDPCPLAGIPDPFDEIDSSTEAYPSSFLLHSVFPNPFNPITAIGYELPEPSSVLLSVLDIQGRQVAELVNGFRDTGTHEVTFDGSGLASGIYLYRLEAGDFSRTGKMVLMK